MATKEKQIEEGVEAELLLKHNKAFITTCDELRKHYIGFIENSDYTDTEGREAAYRKLAALQDLVSALATKVSIFHQIREAQDRAERTDAPTY